MFTLRAQLPESAGMLKTTEIKTFSSPFPGRSAVEQRFCNSFSLCRSRSFLCPKNLRFQRVLFAFDHRRTWRVWQNKTVLSGTKTGTVDRRLFTDRVG